jgi:hypothetical protein
VQLAARMHNTHEMRILRDEHNVFAQRAAECARLIAACIARSNVHYGVASTPQIDVKYRLQRYDKGQTQWDFAVRVRFNGSRVRK